MYGGGVMIMLCFSVSVFCKATVVDPDKELIFNADRKTFDRITEIDGQCFTACPAITDDQQEFNKAESITKNGLFLRDSIASAASHNTPLVECENNYKPTIVFRKDSKMFDIGYEIDQLKTKKKQKKLTNRFLGILSTSFGLKKSKSLKNSKSSSSTTSEKYSDSDVKSVTKDNQGDANGVQNGPKDDAEKDLKKNLRLFWIQIFQFDFDFNQYGPIKVVYSADLGKLNTAYECKDYKADEELYKKVDFKSMYDQANQKKLFENLPAFPNISDGQCGQKYGCLKPHQLIPHYYYHSQASKITTCSAVNTIPVWERISDGILRRIDQYLYAITKIWGPNVTITTGVTDILSYSTGSRSRFRKIIPRKLFMDLVFKKIPVPEIIYKIVKFRKNTNEFHVVIVIHNDPLATKMYHVCPPDENNSNHNHLLKSWSFVVNKTAEFGLSYPCLMNEEVLDRLKVSRKRSNDLFYIPLLLSRLPYAVSTKEEQIIDQKNMDEVASNNSVEKELTIDEKKQMIEAQMKELFGDDA